MNHCECAHIAMALKNEWSVRQEARLERLLVAKEKLEDYIDRWKQYRC